MYSEEFMKEALKQAKLAKKYGETPIGAVIVCNGKIISKGRNRREGKNSSLCHAEIEAIGRACKKIDGGCAAAIYMLLLNLALCVPARLFSRGLKTYILGHMITRPGALEAR